MKLAGWSWESTRSRIAARPHPSIITPAVLPAEAAKRWRERGGRGPHRPPEGDHCATVRTKGTSRQRRNVSPLPPTKKPSSSLIKCGCLGRGEREKIQKLPKLPCTRLKLWLLIIESLCLRASLFLIQGLLDLVHSWLHQCSMNTACPRLLSLMSCPAWPCTSGHPP